MPAMYGCVASGVQAADSPHILPSDDQTLTSKVYDFTAFARRQPLIPKSVDVNQLVVSLEDLLRRTIGEAIDLSIVAADGLWTTLCDPNQLESALLNLAINARDAMPDGGRLTISTANARIDDMAADAPALSPGEYICIDVTDTGTGMSAGVDLALALLAEDLGADLARVVAKILVVYHRRAGGQSQFSTLLDLDAESDRIRTALAYAKEHLSAPLSVQALARVAFLSLRKLSRLFREP